MWNDFHSETPTCSSRLQAHMNGNIKYMALEVGRFEAGRCQSSHPQAGEPCVYLVRV